MCRTRATVRTCQHALDTTYLETNHHSTECASCPMKDNRQLINLDKSIWCGKNLPPWTRYQQQLSEILTGANVKIISNLEKLLNSPLHLLASNNRMQKSFFFPYCRRVHSKRKNSETKQRNTLKTELACISQWSWQPDKAAVMPLPSVKYDPQRPKHTA